MAVGAIFTFAVTGHPSFLNLQIAGVVIMATGVAGLSDGRSVEVNQRLIADNAALAAEVAVAYAGRAPA